MILELNTGIFPDAETLSPAIATLEATHGVERIDVRGTSLEDSSVWDAVVSKILEADLIVTL